MLRKMQCAGLFYPHEPESLNASLRDFFMQTEQKQTGNAPLPVKICMLPHAGHIYSGTVTAQTLSQIRLPQTLIMLCPNHTGLGRHGAVWDSGAFETPLGPVKISDSTARQLLQYPFFTADRGAHLREHSIEVILPFLQYQYGGSFSIVPVSLMNTDNLDRMAQAVSQIMADSTDTGLVISSDMNHFADEKENRRKDFLALEAIKNLDEKALFQTVITHDISMCGVLGAYIGIRTAKALGLQECRIAGYDTSARTSGDAGRVVGYAGLYFM